MTSNKPEVVAWLHHKRQDSDVISDKVKHVWGTPLGSMAQYTVPLIRLSDYEALQAKCDALRAKNSLSIGVGDGTGNLFVYGDYDSIKRVQEFIFGFEKMVEALELAHMALIGYLPSHRNDITDAAISHCEQALATHRKGGDI